MNKPRDIHHTQLRVRPHNDESDLCVIELAVYVGDPKVDLLAFDTPHYDEVVAWDDLPDALIRLDHRFRPGR